MEGSENVNDLAGKGNVNVLIESKIKSFASNRLNWESGIKLEMKKKITWSYNQLLLSH